MHPQTPYSLMGDTANFLKNCNKKMWKINAKVKCLQSSARGSYISMDPLLSLFKIIIITLDCGIRHRN